MKSTRDRGSELGPEHYDRVYSESTEYRKHYTESQYYFLWCVIVDRIQPKAEDRVLDVGCGPGQLARFLKDRGLGDYLGVDFSKETISQARANCPGLRFQEADVFNSDVLETFPYSIVLCTEFLEHVSEDLRLLGRIRRGSKVIGTVPNFPYQGHVRHFGNIREVGERYSGLFRSWRCDPFNAGPDGPTYFLFEGTKV